MYKFMRRLLAMTLALAVCTSVVVFPALADSSEPPVSVTITVTEADGSKTTTTTTTTTTTSTAGGTTTTQGTENWESHNVKTDSQKSESGSTTTTVDTNITTDKRGSETTTVSQDSTSVSGSTTGEEATDVTNTTTTTTVTKDALISSETDPKVTADPTEKWETTSTEEGNWTPGELKTGTAESTKVNSTQSGTISYNRNTDVTLNMSSSNNFTDSKEVVVAASDVASGKIVLPTTAGTTTEKIEEIKDDSGYVIGYKITTISVEAVANGYKVTTVVSETGNPTVSDPTVADPVYGDETAAAEAPQGYTPGESNSTVTEGDKTIDTKEVITEITDGNGNVIGYRIETTKTTTAPSTKEIEPESSSDVTYIMPEKPEESVTTDAAGNTTTVTVEEIVEDGEVVGYQRNVIITDASGTELYTEQEMLYRTKKTDSTQVVKDADTLVTTETTVKTVMGTALRDGTQTSTKDYEWSTTVNTTEDVYNQLKANGDLYVVYKGTMFQVSAGEGHGTVTMTSVQPNYAGLMPPANTVDTVKDLYHRTNEDQRSDAVDFDDYDFQWLGEYGLESAIRVRTETYETGYQAHQFVLQDASGQKHYVYCADLMTKPKEGYRYNMENVSDASYYNSESAAKIQAIAVNGYWGTASGTGSLAAVKQMLQAAKDAGDPLLTDFDVSQLTDGEAMAATQAAIWVFGNSNTEETRIKRDDPVGQYYKGGKTFENVDAASEARVKALFDYLLKTPAPSSDTTTPLITKKDFATEASITVKDKLANDKYKTDVSFNLAIEKSKLTGNLSVKVVDGNGKVLAEKYLATNDTNLVGKLFTSESITSDGKYVFRDLEIAPGTTINLALSGTQNLGFGAYLYTAEVQQKDGKEETSQTFVGLSSGTRQVNLNVGLQFEVEDPTRTTTVYDPATRTDTRTDSKVDTLHQMKVKTETTVNTQKNWYGTVTTTNTLTQTTHSHRNWSSSFFRYLPTDEPGGGTPGGDGDRLRGGWGSFALADNFISEIIIPDEGVPLAGVPKTGDLSILWIALSAVSVAGYFLLSRKKETQA